MRLDGKAALVTGAGGGPAVRSRRSRPKGRCLCTDRDFAR